MSPARDVALVKDLFKRLNAVLNKHFKPIEHIEPIELLKYLSAISRIL